MRLPVRHCGTVVVSLSANDADEGIRECKLLSSSLGYGGAVSVFSRNRGPGKAPVKYARDFITSTLVGGLFVRERVHILDIPFTQAIKSVSLRSSGSKDLVAAMRKQVIGRSEGETVESRPPESFNH